MPQLLSSIPEFYLEAVGKLPGECVNVDMLLLRIPDPGYPPPPPPGVPGDILSPWALYLAPPARRWHRWYRACSPPRTGTCQSPPGSAWRTASPRPALLPGPVQKRPPRAGEGHQDPCSARVGAHGGLSGEGAAWTKPPCAVLSQSWIPGCRGSPALTHVGTWKPGG